MEQLVQAASGYRTTQALYVAAKLGVADYLQDGPKTAEDIARQVVAHPPALFRVLRALAALGFFTQDASNRFGLTTKSRFLLSGSPTSLRAFVIMTGEELYRAAGELLHTVRTGETAFNHLYGMGTWEYLSRNLEAGATFNAAMGQTLQRTENPLDGYDFAGRHVVVDVGGGRGDQIVRILRSNPRTTGILYELPQVASDARTYLKASGVADRCELVTGSAFESIPSGGDVYILSRVLHAWPDDKAAVLLANCRRAITKDGVLLIRDSVLPEGDAPSPGKQLDLTMLFMVGGQERSEPEWRSLLLGSGFRVANISQTRSPLDLVEAKPI